MSNSNNSEIQFIRCESCNSLVPTTASRCRMCGFDLTGGSDVQESAKSSSTRVTQKTMTIGADKIKNIKLSAQESKDSGSPNNIAENITEELAAKLNLNENAIKANKGISKDHVDEPVIQQNTQSQDIPKVELGINNAVNNNRVNNLNRTKEINQPSNPSQAPKQKIASPQQPVFNNIEASKKTNELQLDQEKVEQKKKNFKKLDNNKQQLKNRNNNSSPNMKSNNTNERNSAIVNKGVIVPNTYANSKLIGWMVDYNDSKSGVSSEIRQGRYLVCGEKLRPSDITILKEDVSTPHCLISATEKDGIKIIDLESEHGTFLGRGRSKLKKIERVDVVNGDIIRFGSYEVRICIIQDNVIEVNNESLSKKVKTSAEKNESKKKSNTKKSDPKKDDTEIEN